MPRPPAITHQEKASIVLRVLARQMTLAQAALEAGVTTQAVSNWRKQFIEAGAAGLRSRQPVAHTTVSQLRIKQQEQEIEELKIALAEAHLHMRGRGLRRLPAAAA